MKIKNINFNINNILKLIPHRYPFLLIDRILSYKNKNFIRVLKNVTINDPILQGHFPDFFVFPGVLILESIAQSSIILADIKYPEYKEKNGFYCITGIDHARFKSFVIPGDQMIIEVKILKKRKNVFFFSGIVLVNNKIICSAKIMCAYILYI